MRFVGPVFFVLFGILSPLLWGAETLLLQPIESITDGLAAYYHFNQPLDESGMVIDESDHGVNLSVVGKPLNSTEGVFGKAVLLEGSYLQAKVNPLVGAEEFTISIWFKTVDPTANYKLVAAARWAGGNNASGWNVGTHYSEFWADNQAGSLRGLPDYLRRVTFRSDEWNHLVVSCNRERVREFINGKPSFDCPATGKQVGEGVPMTVGAWMDTFRFHGALDELRIYRRALRDEEVEFLHSAPSGRGTQIKPVALQNR